MLHGFASTGRHWDRVAAALPRDRFTPLALNLGDADPLTPEGVTKLVAASTDGPFVLVGYSMGGRLALHAALAIPERISRLVLISTSAGIADGTQRAARKLADDALAEEIERSPISSFIERWRTTPLFARDPDWVQAEVAADERRCEPARLAVSLRQLGAGAMTPVWDRLHELRMPVSVLAGEDDAAYSAAGRRLAAAIENSTLRTLPGVGHRVALEAPDEVAVAIGAG